MPLSPADVTATRAVFDATSWFGALPEPVKQAFLRRATARRVRKGDVLTVQGTPLDGVGVILEGEVEWFRQYGNGQQALMYQAGPGAWLGLGNILAGIPLVTAIASTKGRVVLITRAQFEDLVREHPRFYRDLTRVLVALLDVTLGMLAEAREFTAEARVCSHLATFAELRARDARADDGEPLALPLSQAQLAGLVGLSRQRVNTILVQLGDLGLVVSRFRKIVVPDVVRLRAHAIACMGRPESALARGDAADARRDRKRVRKVG